MVTSLVKHTIIPPGTDDDIAECGFRMEYARQPDGTMDLVNIPLTEEEFLHPEEGYKLPNNTYHEKLTNDIFDMLNRRYASNPTVAVHRDVIIVWDRELRNHCPDTFVVFGIKNKGKYRTKFYVARERARPSFIIEVVSPRYRSADRQKKLDQYEQAGVQEYVIMDRRNQGGQEIEEILGYRLVDSRYRPIVPDIDGWIACETVGLWISIEDEQVLMEDMETGERLLTSRELEAIYRETKVRARDAEIRARDAEIRARDAETENATLKAQLQALQSRLEP